MEVCWDGDVGKGTAGARACVCVRVRARMHARAGGVCGSRGTGRDMQAVQGCP